MSNQDDLRAPARVEGPPVIVALETSSRVGSVALALGPNLLEESQFSGRMQHSTEIFPAIDGLLRRHGYAPPDIGQVHLAIGPGSFTGLRIAVTIAKAMHLAHAVRIVTVDSLDVVAANLSGDPKRDLSRLGAPDAPSGQIEADGPQTIPDRIAVLFDAKRGQFYASVYRRVRPGREESEGTDNEEPGYRIPAPDKSLWQKIAPDSLLTAQEIMDRFAGPDPLGLLGDGLFYHRDQFSADRTLTLPERYWSPHAANVYRLAYQKAQAGLFADPLALTPFYLRGPEVTLRKKP